MIYAVIPFEPDKELRVRLDKLKNEHEVSVYDGEAPHAYFASFHGTTHELAKAIGYDDDNSPVTGIVIPVANYFGCASKDLWEWLEVYTNGN